MKRTLIVIALAAALVLAGCAGPGGEGVNNTSNATDGAAENDTGFGDDGEENDTGDALGNDSGNDTGMNDTSALVAVADA